jgi:glycosyltransferase involved in cell wall biosynthesis
MLKDDYDVVVCCPDWPAELSRWVQSQGLRHLPARLPFPIFNHYNGGSSLVSRTFVRGLWQGVRFRAQWTDLIRSVDPQLVMVNSAVLAPLGRAIRRTGTPSVCFVRETFPDKRRSLRTRVLHRLIDTTFDGVLFLSEHDREVAGPKAAASSVVRDCVSEDPPAALDRASACREVGVPEDTFNVLYVGGASRIKGLDVVLASLGRLRPADIRLVVAGPPFPERDVTPGRDWINRLVDRRTWRFRRRVEEVLSRPEVSGRTVVVGMQDDMAACFASADVLVFPSTSPHQARPVFEAGLFGVPVIMSDFAETAELVTAGVNGLTFPAGDSDALAACIQQLYNDGDARTELGVANHDMSLRDHAFATEKARLLDFVSSLVRLAPGRPA